MLFVNSTDQLILTELMNPSDLIASDRMMICSGRAQTISIRLESSPSSAFIGLIDLSSPDYVVPFPPDAEAQSPLPIYCSFLLSLLFHRIVLRLDDQLLVVCYSFTVCFVIPFQFVFRTLLFLQFWRIAFPIGWSVYGCLLSFHCMLCYSFPVRFPDVILLLWGDCFPIRWLASGARCSCSAGSVILPRVTHRFLLSRFIMDH